MRRVRNALIHLTFHAGASGQLPDLALRLLTVDAIKSRTLPLHDAPNGRLTDSARQGGAVIHVGVKLEMARFALRVGKVTQCAAAFGYGFGQHLPNGCMQARSAHFTDF